MSRNSGDIPAGLSLAVRAVLGLYGLAWRALLPGLKRNGRLAEGWAGRTLAAGLPPRADLWLQAASGGEAYLAWEMLRQLPAALAHLRPQGSAPLRVHATTFTSQGLGILTQAKADLASILELTPAYFPFDLPGNMDKALDAVRPRAVALLETELWPGLLAACRRRGVPALVLNGRMTEKSLRGYGTLPWFWRALAPALVLAVSDEDADRFARAFGPADIRRMPNIKFDRLRLDAAPDAETQRPPFASLIPRQADGSAPFVVLGSVRKEEEDQVLRIIQGLRQALPGLTIGLFPRHMRRVCVWERLLREAGVPFALRSENRRGAPGSVLLWDEFGELGEAFSLASAAFLGGSLADLGGQNFLEPLAHGVVPVTGPSWSNFAWVGREIFETGIVRLVKDWQGVLAELSALALAPPDRDEIRAKAKAYAASRRGGAAAACQAVAELLKNA
ncbi:MAG: 3-deoxy-D-manno-octulosonic acid transferase [Proteobacteria bacterium]|nr:3-deoxy-D-manno-octulosonic acid transferase [Pseudomonadota bacterium]MBU1595503.1 3-deoxy-D-manno-octulosonic acid transferase [Pseudomonadota bacterium]